MPQFFLVPAMDAALDSSTPAPTISSFTNSPAITGLTTTAAQGFTIVITGTGLTGATVVQFGGTNAASFVVDSSTQITAVVAAGTTGSVSVTTPGGTASLAGFTFIDLNTSLTHAYKMDEATGAARADLGTGAKNLTNTNNAAQVAGIAGNATGFTAASTQQLSNSSFTTFNGATKFSLSFWIKRTAAGDVIGIQQRVDGANLFSVEKFSDGVLYFEFGNAGASFGSVALAGTGWNHVVLVYDGGQATNALKCKGYVDGVAQTLSFTGTIPTSLPTLSGVAVRIGLYTATYANGAVDAMQIWLTRALAQADISLLAGAGTPIEYQGSSIWRVAS